MDDTVREQEPKLQRLAEQYRANGEISLQRQAKKWLLDAGIIYEYAKRMVNVDTRVFEHDSVAHVVSSYLQHYPRDTPSIEAMCSPFLQQSLQRFLTGFPDILDANEWLQDYLADIFRGIECQVIPDFNQMTARTKFYTQPSARNRSIFPGVLLNLGVDEDEGISKDVHRIAQILGIGLPATGRKRWYHGCFKTRRC